MKRTDLIAAVVLAALLSTAATAEAGWPRRQCQGGTYQPAYGYGYSYAYPQTQQPAYQAAPVAVRQVSYQAATADAGDAYGFVSWINGVRARYGLRALAWSADAAAHAAINSARGFGHTYMGGTRRQNVGMGSLGQVEQGWLASPGHFSAIVDPSVTEVGIAYVNGVWTMNAR